jgi:uncharacterized damage-inducible protein DinB
MPSTAADSLAGQVIEAWRINNRINLFLIDRIDDEGWTSTMSSRGGRDVARQFAHLHNVRLSWLEVSAKDLRQGLKTFEGKASPAKAAVKTALEASGLAIERLLVRGLEDGGRLRGFRRGVVPALGYLVAHDSHHRGSILLTLKLSGHKVDTGTQYGIWEWEKR